MGDLQNPRVIRAKGILFLLLGLVAPAMLLARAADLRVGLLLAITVWAFCRSSYFAFCVIEHDVDSEFRSAGLTDFFRDAIRRRGFDDTKQQPSALPRPCSSHWLVGRAGCGDRQSGERGRNRGRSVCNQILL